MQILAIFFNLLLLGVVVFLFVTEGTPEEGEGWLILMAMWFAPVFSLIAIFWGKGDNWLALYFKRKALEEKQKIDHLSGNKD